MPHFLQQFAEQLFSQHRGDLHAQRVVLPSKRAILQLQQLLIEQAKGKALALPHFISVDEFWSQWSGYAQCDALSQQLLLWKSAQKVFSHLEFEAFESWSQVVLSDFNEIDFHLIDTRSFFANVDAAKVLATWNPEQEEPTAAQLQYLEFWKNLPALYYTFIEELKANGMAYSGFQLRTIAEQIDNNLPAPLNFNQLHFVGFNALSKAELKAFSYLKSSFNAQFYWEEFPHWQLEAVEGAGFFIRQNIALLGQDLKIVSPPLAELNWPQLHFYETGSVHQEAALIAQMLSTNTNLNTALLADESLLLPLLPMLPQQTAFNLTMGFSLKQSNTWAWLELIRKLVLEIHQAQKVGRHRWNSFSSHRVTALLCNLKGVALSEHPPTKEDVLKLDALFPSAFLQMLADLDKGNVESVMQAAIGLLETVASVEDELSALEVSALRNMHAALVVNKPLALAAEHTISSAKLFALLVGALGQDKLAILGDATHGKQIIGLLESRSLSFDEILIAEAAEGILPKHTSNQSYIPSDIRYAFQLPGKREKELVFANYFFRIIFSSKVVHLTLCSAPKTMGASEWSRFVHLLKVTVPPSLQLSQSVSSAGVVNKPRLSIDKSEAVLEKIRAYLTTKALSPSGINTFIHNPFDFYLSRIAGVEENKLAPQEFDEAKHGDLLHLALEKAYSEVLNQPLTPALIKAIESKALEVYHIEQQGFINQYISPQDKLVLEMGVEMLQRFFKWELERVKKSSVPIVVVGLEQSVSRVLNCDGIAVTIKGTIDRVERMGDLFKVLDYKSGNVASTDVTYNPKRQNARPFYHKQKLLQLLLYSWMSKDQYPNQAMSGILALRANNNYFEAKVLDFETFDDRLEEMVTQALISIIGDMLNPTLPFEYDQNSFSRLFAI